MIWERLALAALDEARGEAIRHVAQRRVEPFTHFAGNVPRNAEIGTGHAAGDAGERVSIST